MGCGRSKLARDAPAGPGLKEFAAIAAETPFSVDEVEGLFELYKKLSNSVVQDGYIQKEELQFALFRNTTKQSLFLDRMFDLFDLQKNGYIEFGEFVRSLSIFHPRTPEAVKIKHAFRLYDLRGTGFIEHEELKEMVSAILLESDLHLSEEIVGSIVDQTFLEADLNGDGKIDLEEWKDYVTKNPKLLRNMTLPYLMDITFSFPSFKLNEHSEAELLPSPVRQQK